MTEEARSATNVELVADLKNRPNQRLTSPVLPKKIFLTSPVLPTNNEPAPPMPDNPMDSGARSDNPWWPDDVKNPLRNYAELVAGAQKRPALFTKYRSTHRPLPPGEESSSKILEGARGKNAATLTPTRTRRRRTQEIFIVAGRENRLLFLRGEHLA